MYTTLLVMEVDRLLILTSALRIGWIPILHNLTISLQEFNLIIKEDIFTLQAVNLGVYIILEIVESIWELPHTLVQACNELDKLLVGVSILLPGRCDSRGCIKFIVLVGCDWCYTWELTLLKWILIWSKIRGVLVVTGDLSIGVFVPDNSYLWLRITILFGIYLFKLC